MIHHMEYITLIEDVFIFILLYYIVYIINMFKY